MKQLLKMERSTDPKSQDLLKKQFKAIRDDMAGTEAILRENNRVSGQLYRAQIKAIRG